jgi:hypothetical protein
MRSAHLLGALLACACVATAVAAPRSIRRCVRFDQSLDTDGETVRLELANRCKVPVTCALEWVVRCDGEIASRGERNLALAPGAAEVATASAAACDGDWSVDDVRWSCTTPEAP